MRFRIIFLSFLTILLVWILFFTFQYFSKAAYRKANIRIDSKSIAGPLPYNWKAFAQGGEEMGVRMLQNVIPEVSALSPRYIRIDHIYDFYNVLGRDSSGNLTFNWDSLDATVCDIYHTGARPFFSLGYMASAISKDGSLISLPTSWNDWSLVVQKTIERYSGKNTRICGQIYGDWLKDVYYEVWNEPDLESFGKWSLYNSDKDYKTLYYYSVKGAEKAQNVSHFFIGGPVTTAAYQNWFKVFLDYVTEKNLRIDFLSWHHYSKNPDDYADDVARINFWLSSNRYAKYQRLPKIISEWGYDSEPNPISDTDLGAAHSINVIRNLIVQNLEMAFAFEIKDGPTPRWGLLSYTGEKKPRYHALKFLNLLGRSRLKVIGEGSNVKAISSLDYNKVNVILVNFDPNSTNNEYVPVTFTNLTPGTYQVSEYTLASDDPVISTVTIAEGQYQRIIPMVPNSVVALELFKLQ